MNFLKKIFNTKTTTTLTVTSSNGFHLRPIAKFVNEAKRFNATITLKAGGKEVSAIQVPKILSLSLEKGDSFELKCKGKEAQKASEELSRLFKELMRDDREIENIKQEQVTYSKIDIKGEIIAKGVAIGRQVNYTKQKVYSSKEGLSLKDALNKTAQELESLYQQNRTKSEAEIFLAQKELLQSDAFQLHFETIEEEIDKLKNTKFKNRIPDYLDLKQRIESHMGIETTFELPNKDVDTILFAKELLPSEVEEISKISAIKGVVLFSGSTTSHASILLRSFNIPSIITQKEFEPLEKETILDASAGVVISEPNEKDLTQAKERQEAFKKEQEQRFQK